MVNRILIRIKVVQMLYAYLLTRTEFKIEADGDTGSADKKFASTAYVALLTVLLRLNGSDVAGLSGKTKLVLDKKLMSTYIGKVLTADNAVRTFLRKEYVDCPEFYGGIQEIHDIITETAVYKDFKRKRKIDLGDEVKMWMVLMETTMQHAPRIMAVMRRLPGFTAQGYEMAVERLVSTLNSYFELQYGYHQALKELESSLTQAHKLYISMFALIVKLTRARENQLESAKNKYLATAEDKNPNTKFVDNALAAALAQNKELETLVKEYAIDWIDDITLLNSLLEQIVRSPVYARYMAEPETDWERDCEFWREIMKSVIFQSDDLVEALEGVSVYWNDDLHIIGTFVLKTLRMDAQNPERQPEFLPRYKDDEDSRFGAELFELVVKNRTEYYDYIDKFVNTANWDADRVAFMDGVIMVCAIAEMLNFPNIPLAVTLNEYIDIANMYSTPKSGQFINGLLYNVVEYLKKEGKLYKN